MKRTEPEYSSPVENLLDLIYERYTREQPGREKHSCGKAVKAKEKELEEWLRGLEGIDRLVFRAIPLFHCYSLSVPLTSLYIFVLRSRGINLAAFQQRSSSGRSRKNSNSSHIPPNL